MSVRPVQRMRTQADVEVQIAIAPAIQPLAALARQAQTLAIGRTLRNARPDSAGHAMQPALLIVFGHVQIEIDLRAVEGLIDADRDRDLIVVAGHRHARPAPARTAADPTAAQMCEQIGQIDIIGREGRPAVLLLPARRRLEFLPGGVAPELVVGGALLGILERLIRLGDFLEFLLGTGLLGDIGMVFARQPAISLLDIVVAGTAFQTEAGVVVLVFHDARRG